MVRRKKYPSIEVQLASIRRVMNSNHLFYTYSEGEYSGYSMRYIYDEDPLYLLERCEEKLMTLDELKAYRSF